MTTDRVIVHGCAASYYLAQLVLAAVRKIVPSGPRDMAIEVMNGAGLAVPRSAHFWTQRRSVKSVERLVGEHELIERGLNLLEKAVARLEAGQALREAFPQWATGDIDLHTTHGSQTDLFNAQSIDGIATRV